MITADGRSAVEVEIEQMHFTGLETTNSPFAPVLADLNPHRSRDRSTEEDSAFSASIKRWIDRLFHLQASA